VTRPPKSSLSPPPEILVSDPAGLPFLVEHWFLASRTRRYMILRRIRDVLEAAGFRATDRVLELGTGWAYGSHWARQSGARAVGIDLGLDQLRWARRSLAPDDALHLAQANAKALPFRSATFDAIASVEMMEHVFRPDREAVLAEAFRVLKPGGTIALSTPNAHSPIETLKRLATRWPALRQRLPDACFPEALDKPQGYHPYRYHHPLPVAELRARMEAAGFRVGGVRQFMWVMKTTPDSLLGVACALEGVAERVPLVRRLGATTLVWGTRP